MSCEIRRIAIVGAGMGGLAAANALLRRGFEVKVYEQAPDLGAFGAGLAITPNAVKVFEALGLRKKLHEVSYEPGGLIWRDSNDGSIQNFVSLTGAKARYGAQYYNSYRGDVHTVLASGVPSKLIDAGRRCVGVQLHDDLVGLQFSDGSSEEADVVIGCDGIRSSVRRSLFGGPPARYSGHMCWRSLVPVDALPKDFHDGNTNNWTGPDGFVLSYFVRQGRFINIVAVRPQPAWEEESWAVPSSRAEMLSGFSRMGEKAQILLGNASDVFKWGQFMGAPADQWTKGRVTLLGDAAHAMLATFGQGAASTFEDAYALAEWFDSKRDDYVVALAGYENSRKPRTQKLQALSRTEVNFKRLHTLRQRLRREWTYLSRFGLTTRAMYKWIYGFDPVNSWR